MNRSIFFLFLLAATITARSALAADETPSHTLFRFPIGAEAKVVRFDHPFAVLTVDIVHKQQKFRLSGLMQRSGSAQQAIGQQKAQSGWKDSYFFLRDDCAGCNAARGTTDHVFVVRERWLRYLGEVAVEDPEKVGSSLDEGIFNDIYDKFEANELTSHADGPRVLIARRDSFHGHTQPILAVDLPLTWAMNQERFQAGQRCLATVAKIAADAMECSEEITPLRALVFNAVLTAYTQHTSELQQIKHVAKAVLCINFDEVRCKQKLVMLDNLLARVVPGELPLPRNPAREISAIVKNKR